MRTISVDDRSLVVEAMERILLRVDPQGRHLITTNPKEALAMAWEQGVDVAFIDVEMPGMDGIILARQMQQIHPLVNIIFITGYQEYAPKAWELYASGYILKPVTETAVRDALLHLRYQPPEPVKAAVLTVRCFGSFEVFSGGKSVSFAKPRCKELFALLVDRRGASCSVTAMVGALWPGETPTDTRKGQVRAALSELGATLKQAGAGEALIRGRDGVAVDVTRLDCDYYRYLDGDPRAMCQFHGEYMSQYPFAQHTLDTLLRR